MIRAHGPDEIVRGIAAYGKAFPQRRHELSLILEAGATVALEGEWVATHSGPLATPDGELPATGRTVRVPFAAVIRVAGGSFHDGTLSPNQQQGDRNAAFRHTRQVLYTDFDSYLASASAPSVVNNTGGPIRTDTRRPNNYRFTGAIQREIGKNVVVGNLVYSVVLGMSVADVSAKAIANLGIDKLRLSAPVFPGDTIYAESEVIDKRESRSRPTQGVVTVRTTAHKADGTVFMTYERSALIPKRGHGVEDRA